MRDGGDKSCESRYIHLYTFLGFTKKKTEGAGT